MKILLSFTFLFSILFCFQGCNTDNPIEVDSITEQSLSTSPSQLNSLTIESDEFHLISPVSGFVSTNERVTFTWDEWNMSGYYLFDRYELRIKSTTGSGIDITHYIHHPQYTSYSTDLVGDTYEWNVIAYYYYTDPNPWQLRGLLYEENWWWFVVRPPYSPSLSSSWYLGHPKITWDEVENADGYKVYKCNVPWTSSELLADITTMSYIDYGESYSRTSSGEYIQYGVVAYNTIGSGELDPNSWYFWVEVEAIGGED